MSKKTRYSVEPRDRIFVKGYGFLSFAKNMGQNICENISKNLSGKHRQETKIQKEQFRKQQKQLMI